MKTEPLKRAIIKEEFVALTGNHEQAIILNQFDYWAHRTNDIDKYIDDEIARRDNPETIDILEKTKTNGWIYKSAKELLSEVMMSISEKTARRHLITLVKHGWLQERSNPEYKWDKTKQYRYNLLKVAKDLQALSYSLEGWKIVLDSNVASKRHDVPSKGRDVAPNEHSDEWKKPPVPHPASVPADEKGPEITSEITTDIIPVQGLSKTSTPNNPGKTDDEVKSQNNPTRPSLSSKAIGNITPETYDIEYFDALDNVLLALGLNIPLTGGANFRAAADVYEAGVPIKFATDVIESLPRNKNGSPIDGNGKKIYRFEYIRTAIWNKWNEEQELNQRQSGLENLIQTTVSYAKRDDKPSRGGNHE
jgi:hypothetical protein